MCDEHSPGNVSIIVSEVQILEKLQRSDKETLMPTYFVCLWGDIISGAREM